MAVEPKAPASLSWYGLRKAIRGGITTTVHGVRIHVTNDSMSGLRIEHLERTENQRQEEVHTLLVYPADVLTALVLDHVKGLGTEFARSLGVVRALSEQEIAEGQMHSYKELLCAILAKVTPEMAQALVYRDGH